MRANVGDFLDDIVESKFDRLEALMLHKYKQFLNLYWMLKSYASDIKSIKYNESDKDVLVVVVDVSNADNRNKILYEVESYDHVNSHPDGKSKLVISMTR